MKVLSEEQVAIASGGQAIQAPGILGGIKLPPDFQIDLDAISAEISASINLYIGQIMPTGIGDIGFTGISFVGPVMVPSMPPGMPPGES